MHGSQIPSIYEKGKGNHYTLSPQLFDTPEGSLLISLESTIFRAVQRGLKIVFHQNILTFENYHWRGFMLLAKHLKNLKK